MLSACRQVSHAAVVLWLMTWISHAAGQQSQNASSALPAVAVAPYLKPEYNLLTGNNTAINYTTVTFRCLPAAYAARTVSVALELSQVHGMSMMHLGGAHQGAHAMHRSQEASKLHSALLLGCAGWLASQLLTSTARFWTPLQHHCSRCMARYS